MRRTPRRTPRARVLTTVAAAALGLGLLAGCGGSDGGGSKVASVSGGRSAGSGGKTSPGAKSEAEQAQAFVDCMRTNGVAMEDPDPETGKLDLKGIVGGGADSRKLKAGINACRDKMPQSIQDKAGQTPDAKQLGLMRRFAECMRRNGVDMDDPGPNGLDKKSLQKGQGNTEALNKCREYLAGATGDDK